MSIGVFKKSRDHLDPGLYFSFCECKLKLLQHRGFGQIGGVGVGPAGMDRGISENFAAFLFFECKKCWARGSSQVRGRKNRVFFPGLTQNVQGYVIC